MQQAATPSHTNKNTRCVASVLEHLSEKIDGERQRKGPKTGVGMV